MSPQSRAPPRPPKGRGNPLLPNTSPHGKLKALAPAASARPAVTPSTNPIANTNTLTKLTQGPRQDEATDSITTPPVQLPDTSTQIPGASLPSRLVTSASAPDASDGAPQVPSMSAQPQVDPVSATLPSNILHVSAGPISMQQPMFPSAHSSTPPPTPNSMIPLFYERQVETQYVMSCDRRELINLIRESNSYKDALARADKENADLSQQLVERDATIQSFHGLLADRKATWDADRAGLQRTIREKGEYLTSYRDDVSKQKLELDQLRKQLDFTKTHPPKPGNGLEKLEKEKETLAKSAQTAQEEKTKIEAEKKELETSFAALEERVKEVEKDLAKREEDTSLLKHSHDIASERGRKERDALKMQNEKLSREKETLTNLKDTLYDRNTQLIRENEALQRDVEKLKAIKVNSVFAMGVVMDFLQSLSGLHAVGNQEQIAEKLRGLDKVLKDYNTQIADALHEDIASDEDDEETGSEDEESLYDEVELPQTEVRSGKRLPKVNKKQLAPAPRRMQTRAMGNFGVPDSTPASPADPTSKRIKTATRAVSVERRYEPERLIVKLRLDKDALSEILSGERRR